MPGLLLIVTQTADARFAAAAELAASMAALGRPVAVLVRDAAVLDLARPAFATLLELGGCIGACQTAMAAHGLAAADLPAGVEPLGMLAFLEGRAGWQLLMA